MLVFLGDRGEDLLDDRLLPVDRLLALVERLILVYRLIVDTMILMHALGGVISVGVELRLTAMAAMFVGGKVEKEG